MSLLHWQQIDKNQFAVFIRDLSKNVTNVKYMVEDIIKEKPTTKDHKKGKHKKVVKKKKDIIIEKQTKIRLEKNIKEDLSKIDYLLNNINYDNPYLVFSQMKTEQGLVELKFRMLETSTAQSISR